MSAYSERFASAAEQLSGVSFRLQGRDPATGLDCIGLATCALEKAGIKVEPPAGYKLRNTSIEQYTRCTTRSGLQLVSGAPVRGDILLVCPGPAQQHLLVALGEDRFAHAHAGLRRVVVQSGLSGLPIIKHWRLAVA